MVTLYVVTGQFVISAGIAFDPKVSFSPLLVDGVTAEVAICEALLLPVVVFLVYFAYWGRLGWQVQAAIMGLALSGAACLAYLISALIVRYPLPGNYVNAQLIVAAVSTFVLWSALAIGVQLRWQTLKRRLRDFWNRCAMCQYDLTGNVSGVCPECGREIPGRLAAEALDREA